MDDSDSGPSRFILLTAVLVFHGVLVLVLVMESRPWHVSTPVMVPIELLSSLTPPSTETPKRPDQGLPRPSIRVEVPAPAAPFTLSPLPSSAEGSQPSIDWAREAHSVAADAAAAIARSHPEPEPPPTSVFPEKFSHHAGEQFRTDDGRWMVFVNDNCYQVSAPFLSPNALENGMGLETHCIGKSKEPRGDLFDQLPAYAKYHRAN
jgi:hypothetical protein